MSKIFIVKFTLLNINLAVLGLSCSMFPSATSNLHTPTALHKSLYAVNNEWLSGPVIAILPEVPGECFYCYFSFPPDGVLYADGLQIVEHKMRLYQRTLSNQEVCRLINEIDRSGFFEYTSEEYEQFYRSNRMKPGPVSNWITVNAWKSNSLRLTSLDFLYSMYRDTVEWPDALAVPYERLTAYDPLSMKLYMPERVAVHVEKVPEYGLDYEYEVRTWPLPEPSLGELVERYAETATQVSETSDGEIILSGYEAADMFRYLNYGYWNRYDVFELNGEEYNVITRILLPYEESAGSIEALPLIPDPNIDYEQTVMQCAFTSPARRP